MTAPSGPTNEQRALDYYALAHEFIDAYWKLAGDNPDETDFARDMKLPSVKMWLLGHALELTMKGWLILKEGTLKELTKAQKAAFKSSKTPFPKTLKDYGHSLHALTTQVVAYYPELQPFLNKDVPIWNEDETLKQDTLGNTIMQSAMEHWDSSYDGERDYEYPEGKEQLAHLAPLNKLAEFISRCRHTLGAEIARQNGGNMPPKYKKSTVRVSSPVPQKP